MILITGATGLLGSYLVHFLLQHSNEKLKLLIRNNEDEKKIQSSNRIHFCKGNINDIPSLEIAFKEVTKVYHCAGKISFSPFEQEEMYKINVEGTANIVNFCIQNKIDKLCHVSSVAAIGKNKNSLFSDEKVEWDDSAENSYYGKTKYLGELEVWRGIEEGLNAVIVNPSVILGPAAWNQSSMKLFNYVKNEPKYYTKGGNNFVDVRDVVQIMVLLMNSNINNDRFIIAGERISYQKLFIIIAQYLNVKPPVKEVKSWILDILWRLEHIKSILFKTQPILTKETANVAKRKHEYVSKKVIDTLNYKFNPINETVQWVTQKLDSSNV